jgi:hypothetical protein
VQGQRRRLENPAQAQVLRQVLRQVLGQADAGLLAPHHWAPWPKFKRGAESILVMSLSLHTGQVTKPLARWLS